MHHILEPLQTRERVIAMMDDGRSVIVKRALLYCILAASSWSMHGKLALSVLNKSNSYWGQDDRQQLCASSVLNPKSAKMRKSDNIIAAPSNQCPYDLTFASCMLVLVLGERVACPILEKFDDHKTMIEAILGPVANSMTEEREDNTVMNPPPVRGVHMRQRGVGMAARMQHRNDLVGQNRTSSHFQRAPMPFGVAERVVDFISAQLLPGQPTGRSEGFVDLKNNDSCHRIIVSTEKKNDREALGLFVELVLALRYQNWAIQILEGIYIQVPSSPPPTLPDEWLESFHLSCLEISSAVLSQIAQVDAVGNALLNEMQMQHEDDDEEHPLGVPGRFGGRRDLNQLLADHRGSQRKRQLLSDCALQARKTAYRIVMELAPQSIANFRRRKHSTEGESSKALSSHLFDFPIILFKCASGEEDDGIKLFVSEALDAHLEAFKHLVEADENNAISESQVAPLLPSVLFATCADSSIARLGAAKWAAKFLNKIDPPVALHICTFLAEDRDPFVAAVSKKGLLNIPYSDNARMEDASPGHLLNLDLSDEIEKALIQADLCQKVQELAVTTDLPPSAARVVLAVCDFDVAKACDEMKSNRSKVLGDCGVVSRCVGNASNSGESLSEGLFCEICYDDVGRDDIYAMLCDHKFCCSCWNELIHQELARPLCIVCPEQKCAERVTREDVLIVAPELISRWDDIELQSYVDGNQCYSKCPGPDCAVVVRSDKTRGTSPTCCSLCNLLFCFSCGSRPHQPAHCADFAKWRMIYENSDFWVKKNAKPCPGCNIPIEKRDGCNHMTCAQCSYEFCWLCLGPLRNHLEPHNCNRYEPHEGAENESERRALFFSERFEVHDQAEAFAKNQVKAFVEKREKLATDLWFVSDENLDLRERAARTLLEARNFLKNSYVAAWAMTDNLDIRDSFESYQANLELFTEKLSLLLLHMNKLHHLHHEGGERAIHMHFRAVLFSTTSIEKYMGRILSLLDNGQQSTV